jgi:hypothetical protein
MMKLELVRECTFTDAQHHKGELCTHRALIKVTRYDLSVRWLVDPELGPGHPHFIAGCLEDCGEPGLVQTNPTAFYVALGALAL